jgi:hypothetical protein
VQAPRKFLSVCGANPCRVRRIYCMKLYYETVRIAAANAAWFGAEAIPPSVQSIPS